MRLKCAKTRQKSVELRTFGALGAPPKRQNAPKVIDVKSLTNMNLRMVTILLALLAQGGRPPTAPSFGNG